MEIKKEYLDLNDSFSYHKASANDWRGIGYTEIPLGADIYFMEWFYKEVCEGEWHVWDKHQDVWIPCDYDFREDCPNIHWKREGFKLKKSLSRCALSYAVPEGFVLVPKVITDEWMAVYVDPEVSKYCKEFEGLPFAVTEKDLPMIQEDFRRPIKESHSRLMKVIEAQEQSHDEV